MGWEEGGVGVSSLSELKSFPSNAGFGIILRGLFFLVFGVLSDRWYQARISEISQNQWYELPKIPIVKPPVYYASP